MKNKIVLILSTILLIFIEIYSIIWISKGVLNNILIVCLCLLVFNLLYEGISNRVLLASKLYNSSVEILNKITKKSFKTVMNYGEFHEFVVNYPQEMMYELKSYWDIGVYSVINICILFLFDKQMLLSIGIASIIFIILYFFARNLRSLEKKFFDKRHLETVNLKDFFNTIISKLSTIKGMNLEKKTIYDYCINLKKFEKNNLKYRYVLDIQYLLMKYLVFLPLIIVIIISSHLELNNNYYIYLSILFFTNLSDIFAGFIEVINSRRYHKKIKKILLTNFSDDIFKVNSFKNNIINLNFEYKNFKLFVPEFSFLKGEKILIKGQTGSGKSTLIRYILGLSNVQSDCQYDEIMCRVSYIPQERFIFNDSIKSNIFFKKNTDVIISKLDIDKVIYPESMNISGGESTLVEIYRSIYHESEILIVDELEKNIGKDLYNEFFNKEALKDKSVISVSHKYDDIVNYDKIYEIKNSQLLRIK